MVRTKVFLQATAEAVAQLDTTRQDTIEVVDAGTGAMPVLAIYAALCSSKVRCTALELNPESAKLARAVIEEFGLQDRISVIEADATKYASGPIDLLVSETMCSGLTNEPLVQIMNNLQPQLRPDGITLPSWIGIGAALVPMKMLNDSRRVVVVRDTPYRIVDYNWQDVVRYTPGQPLDRIRHVFDVSSCSGGEYSIAVMSEVGVGSQVLRPYDSLITMPQFPPGYRRSVGTFFVQSGHVEEYGPRIALEYEPGGPAGFRPLGFDE